VTLTDRYGTAHTSNDRNAIAAFERAVHGVAAHQATSGPALAEALAADPHLIAAHALRGLGAVTLAREELIPLSRRAHADALAARRSKGGATAAEAALVEALGDASQGRLLAAAARLEAFLDVHPVSFLHAKLAHGLRFMSGDAAGMLVGTARVLDAWSPGDAGYGFLLGCHAFALEETGELEAAERVGRRAVELEPEDAWGLHAVSHVQEMEGRIEEGVDWLEGSRPVWSRCNNFSFHMAWHLSLFHLERGAHERVLALYDEAVRPEPTDDFRDMANAVSLLWRLRQDGVAVGQRWEELAALAARRRTDTTLTFAALHNLLALVAAGETDVAKQLAAEMILAPVVRRAAGPIAPADQAEVLTDVGRDLAQIIVSLDGAAARRRGIDLGRLARRLQRIGGSHAQRDVFLRTLAEVAAAEGDALALEQVLAVRRRLKRDDRFAARVQAAVEAATVIRLPRAA
jgi:tetratricopeptide (TPR) repeat protein